jgi:hypothetical protein
MAERLRRMTQAQAYLSNRCIHVEKSASVRFRL